MSNQISRRQFLAMTATAAAAVAAPIDLTTNNALAQKTVSSRKKIKNMNVLVLHGSPNEAGNTADLVDIATDILEAKGNKVERLHIADLEIAPCIACMECQKNPSNPGCIYEDDGATVLDAMIKADALIITSPLYFAAFTAHIKPLIDRSFALCRKFGTKDHMSFVQNKPTLFLSTGAGPYKKNGEILEGSCNDYTRFLKLDKIDFFYTSSKPAISEAKKAELKSLVSML